MFNNQRIKVLEKRITDLEKLTPMFKDLYNFTMDLEKLKTHIASLRGLINKRSTAKEDQEETDQEEGKSIKTGMKYY
jgi:GTP1/Obg family GTP-binding protein